MSTTPFKLGVNAAELSILPNLRLGMVWGSLLPTTVTRFVERGGGARSLERINFPGGAVVILSEDAFKQPVKSTPHFPYVVALLAPCTFSLNDWEELKTVIDRPTISGVTWPRAEQVLKCPKCRKAPKKDGSTKYMLCIQVLCMYYGLSDNKEILFSLRPVPRPFCIECLENMARETKTEDVLKEGVDMSSCNSAWDTWYAGELSGIADALCKDVQFYMGKEVAALLADDVKLSPAPVQQCTNLLCLADPREGAAKGAKLKACAACKQAMYCSRECQKLDWKRHKDECAKLIEQANAAAVQEPPAPKAAPLKPLDEDDDLD